MSDEHQGPEDPAEEKGRRFRLGRKVKDQAAPKTAAPPLESREEKEMHDLAAMGDDADRGTPEMDASLRAGCTSFIRLIGLFFVIMFASIIATWCFKR